MEGAELQGPLTVGWVGLQGIAEVYAKGANQDLEERREEKGPFQWGPGL